MFAIFRRSLLKTATPAVPALPRLYRYVFGTSATRHSLSEAPLAAIGALEIRRPPLPPFTAESAARKARVAEDTWNSRDPTRVVQAYSLDSKWRNRSQFLAGRPAIEAFLKQKWAHEQEYRLIKEVWAHCGNRIAVRFVYEYRVGNDDWFRAHGNENWLFDETGLMSERHASINDVAIQGTERKFHWPLNERRPDAHPGLSELGL